MENNESLSELLDSINSSIADMSEHPIENNELPSNLELVFRGVADEEGITKLFSPKIDQIISQLFKKIESGDFQTILTNTDVVEKVLSSIFGEGSFKGPVSRTVLASIQSSMQSQKYMLMKSHLGKTVTTLKKYNLVMKNLKKAGKPLSGEEAKKYKEAVYAIKRVLKLVARIYRNRKLVNKQVWKGLNNIVHEDYEIDEALI